MENYGTCGQRFYPFQFDYVLKFYPANLQKVGGIFFVLICSNFRFIRAASPHPAHDCGRAYSFHRKRSPFRGGFPFRRGSEPLSTNAMHLPLSPKGDSIYDCNFY